MKNRQKDELDGLVAEVALLPRTAGGHRKYPAALRPVVLSALAQYVRAGGAARAFADRLGIHSSTMAFWSDGKQAGKKQRYVRAVQLSDEATKVAMPSSAVVVLPNGARIEGLTTAQLIEIACGGL